MKFIKKLDEILLSEKVVESFYKNYHGEFKDWLLNILPEIEDCRLCEQDNPWHIYGVLDHLLHSVEKMNSICVDEDFNIKRMLVYIMFLHDIGKPKCKIRRFGKVYGRYVDSFFNHNIESCKVADRVLDDFGFNKDEIEIIKKLIFKHDIFMFITIEKTKNPNHKVLTPNLIREEIKDLNSVGNGKKLFEYLLKVGRSDNGAQNPQMTKSSFELLDRIEELLSTMQND